MVKNKDLAGFLGGLYILVLISIPFFMVFGINFIFLMLINFAIITILKKKKKPITKIVYREKIIKKPIKICSYCNSEIDRLEAEFCPICGGFLPY